MNVLLVGEYYSSNLGDPLLCETVRLGILEKYPFAKITPFDLSGKVGPDEYYQMQKRTSLQKYWVRNSRRFGKYLDKILPLHRVYSQSADRFMRVWYRLNEILENEQIDLIVFAGGEMFMDYFTGPIYILLSITKSIPVVFHACGYYSLSFDSRKLLRRELKKDRVKSISLRDSYQIFNDIFRLDYKTHETYDTALLCSKYFSDFRATERNAEFGIGVIAKQEYRFIQEKLVGDLLSSDLDWMLFTNGAEEDYEFACQLLQMNGIEEYDKYLLKKPESISNLICTITSFSKIISFRMHSQICAVSFGIPSFGFVWDKKVATFYDKLGLDKNYSSDLQNIDLQDIISRLNQVDVDLQKVANIKGEESILSLITDIENAIR